MERPMQIPVSGPDDLKDSKWLKLARVYNRTPMLRHVSPFGILAILLGAMLAFLFPRQECTCSQQFTDQKLEAMARQGNKAVRGYLDQKDNPINCAERRRELLQELEKEKNQGQTKR